MSVFDFMVSKLPKKYTKRKCFPEGIPKNFPDDFDFKKMPRVKN